MPPQTKNIAVLQFNWNDIKSIKKAERKKSLFENKGYSLLNQTLNSITGEATFTYKINSNEKA